MSVRPPELSEKDFIRDDGPQNNLPYWLWGILFTMVVALIWGAGSWYSKKMSLEFEDNPFLQVTNREMSIFLWQFPEHMRVNVKTGKGGYLPGFQYTEKISLDPEMADDYVIAPPELLFLYHTWDRLLKPEFIARPLQLPEFKEFLLYAVEWQPKYWPKAPPSYRSFANEVLENENIKEDTLKKTALPKEVVQAFQGWKNYFKEGEEINQVSPTFSGMNDFLKHSPNYARNFWRNIVEDHYPNYLKSLRSKKSDPKAIIPKDELAPFLRVAFFNYVTMQKPSS